MSGRTDPTKRTAHLGLVVNGLGQQLLPASRVANHVLMVWLRTGVSSGNRPMFEEENRKCRTCLEDSPWFVCLGVCLLGRVGKSRCRRGCPDDKGLLCVLESGVC